MLTGHTSVQTEVRVAGGILPATAFTKDDGTFSIEVLLRPGRRNRLTVTAYSATRRTSVRLVVRQRLNRPEGQLSGRVLDVTTRAPIAGATVGYGRQTAEQACRDRGLRPGAGLEQCVLDVGITGDASFADDASVVANRLRAGVDLRSLGTPVEDTAGIQLGRRVSGAIGTPLHTDVYQIDLDAGDTIRISTPGACPGSGTFSITLVAPSGRPIGRMRGDGCGSMGVTGLRESGRYQIRVFDAGGFAGGYELQLDGDQVDLTCRATEVAPNDDGSGPRGPAALHGRLPGPAVLLAVGEQQRQRDLRRNALDLHP